METSAIITAIDEEIAQLRQVRDLLAGGGTSRSIRPVKRRVLSPEARKRIADAQRRRWAAQKKADKKA